MKQFIGRRHHSALTIICSFLSSASPVYHGWLDLSNKREGPWLAASPGVPKIVMGNQQCIRGLAVVRPRSKARWYSGAMFQLPFTSPIVRQKRLQKCPVSWGRHGEPMAKRLLDQLREVLRLKHDSYRTEAYVDCMRRFILFQGRRRLAEVGARGVQPLLAHLAHDRAKIDCRLWKNAELPASFLPISQPPRSSSP